MILTKYIFKDRPSIITIPKCGTRYVRESNWTEIEELNIYPNYFYKISEITKDTIVTYRNPREHIISAIQTDYVWGNYYGRSQTKMGNERKWDLDIIIQNMIDDNSEHWSPNLYKNLYRLWSKFGFQMLPISKLSELFDYEIEYGPELYDSHAMPHFKSKKEILSLIPKDKLDELYTLCDKDELWLNRILNNETGIAILEDLEDANKQIEELTNQLKEVNLQFEKMREHAQWLLDVIRIHKKKSLI